MLETWAHVLVNIATVVQTTVSTGIRDAPHNS